MLACVDGSEHSYAATTTGAWWARTLSAPLHAAAAYDPAFHAEVFQAMAKSLSAQRRKEVGLDDQQDLHDRLIDKGLATLYQGFLDSAAARIGNGDVTEKLLLEGKAYRAVNDCAARLAADLVVLGRFGHHYEPSSQIGSNAEAVARLGGCNVLLTAPAAGGRA